MVEIGEAQKPLELLGDGGNRTLKASVDLLMVHFELSW